MATTRIPGEPQFFSLIAMDAYRLFGLDAGRYHLDSSSFSVHGTGLLRSDKGSQLYT
ncbi:MAG: hypothetical protein ACFCU8_16515 [Thermosynechococcaceae cyanobacterium]